MILTWNMISNWTWQEKQKNFKKNNDDVNLEQSGSRIPGALSVKPIFSLIVAFYLTRTENRTINL